MLDSAELARYSRHILLEEIGVPGQEALKASKTLVVGAGGLGSPVALYLAAAGIGTIGIAEFDKVELHNLQRQILHGASDINKPKIESAQRTLTELNPEVKLRLHQQGVTPDNAVGLFSEYDIIVDGTDNFATRYLNNDAAYFAGKPLVYGSIFKFEGQASIFDPSSGGPCYRCLFPDPPPPGSVPNCGEAGVMGALCGIVGSIEAMETIKRLIGIGDSLLGRLLFIDTLSMRFRSLNLKPDPACPLCGAQPRITNIDATNYVDTCATPSSADPSSVDTMREAPLEIDVEKSKSLLDRGEAILLDVREGYERDICKIEPALHIPMNEVPQRVSELPKDRPLLVHCHHGGRSMNVVRYLRSNGYANAINVGGGIDAWAVTHDSAMQRY